MHIHTHLKNAPSICVYTYITYNNTVGHFIIVKPTLKILLRELRVKAADWEDIGIELEIEDGTLKQIKLDNPGDSKCCLRELLRKWLNQADPLPSWASIIEAVDGIGDESLARRLKEEYIKI